MTRFEALAIATRLARRGYVSEARSVVARLETGAVVIEINRTVLRDPGSIAPDPSRAATTPLTFDHAASAAAWFAELRQAVR